VLGLEKLDPRHAVVVQQCSDEQVNVWKLAKAFPTFPNCRPWKSPDSKLARYTV
jgi:hypothetical protein